MSRLVYQCKKCGAIYWDEKEANECEALHAKVTDVKVDYDRCNIFPSKVNITFDDGSTEQYFRRKSQVIKMDETRIIIAGSRSFHDYDYLAKSVNEILKIENLTLQDNIRIISGTANGADHLGEMFAIRNRIKLIRFPANWDEYGKAAGVIRNRQMAEFASEDSIKGILIVFWDGESKGSKNMIDEAKKRNLKIYLRNI